MLAASRAFSGYSVDSMDAAREFYGEVLGVRVTPDHGMLFLELEGGNRVLLYPKDDHRPAGFTVLNFPVPDVEAAVDALTARGVSFERYEGFPQDDKGVVRDPDHGPAIAWFKDPAGNVLSVIEDD
ncbi:VOC family protein [Streptomyces sp. NPDC097619]|uniref:VOC family protein n=1 Tax=Streptomyces sp. NPDC097619 TaxID=3157228 RepID=UPI00332472F6